MHCMFPYTMIVQLEYINHLLQFFENISYYAGIMLNVFSDLLCSLYWHNRGRVPTPCYTGFEVIMFTILCIILLRISCNSI